MTGFGVGDAPLGDGRVVVELRALNHRFLDVRVRLPEELLDQNFFIEQLARESLARGRFDIGVRLEGAALPPPRFSVERARALYRGLAQLRDELAPGTELPVTALTGMPDLVTNPTTADSEGARHDLTARSGDVGRLSDAPPRTAGPAAVGVGRASGRRPTRGGNRDLGRPQRRDRGARAARFPF